MKRLLCFLALLVGCLTNICPSARAQSGSTTPLTYDDGGTLSGTITFNGPLPTTLSETVPTSWNFTETPGPGDASTFPAVTYNSSNSSAYFFSGYASINNTDPYFSIYYPQGSLGNFPAEEIDLYFGAPGSAFVSGATIPICVAIESSPGVTTGTGGGGDCSSNNYISIDTTGTGGIRAIVGTAEAVLTDAPGSPITLTLEGGPSVPTPEPSSLLLFGVGLAALLGGSLFRRQTS